MVNNHLSYGSHEGRGSGLCTRRWTLSRDLKQNIQCRIFKMKHLVLFVNILKQLFFGFGDFKPVRALKKTLQM